MFVRGDSDSYVDETMRQVYVRCVNQRRRGHCPPVADQGGITLFIILLSSQDVFGWIRYATFREVIRHKYLISFRG